MTRKYQGSCMCGKVAFSFVGDPVFVADCVCDSCRRAHGASAVCWVGVKDAQFSMDRGDGVLGWYPSSSDSDRGFCSNCGTRVFFRSSRWPGETHLALACMEMPHDLVASTVSFAEELPPWTAMSIRDQDS